MYILIGNFERKKKPKTKTNKKKKKKKKKTKKKKKKKRKNSNKNKNKGKPKINSHSSASTVFAGSVDIRITINKASWAGRQIQCGCVVKHNELDHFRDRWR